MNPKEQIDPVLTATEFPGEEESLIRAWLESRDFADSVVAESRRLRVISHRSVLWGSAATAVVAAGILAGSSPLFEAVGAPLSTFAFLLFGVLVTVSLAGLLSTLHPSWRWDQPARPPEVRPGARSQRRP